MKKSYCQIDKADLSVHPVLKAHLGYCFFKSAVRMRAKLDQGLNAYGLLTPQFAILRLLDHAGPSVQNELGKSMGIDKASMVKFLSGLEKRKLITRLGDAGDRRVKMIAITPAGKRLFKKAMGIRDKVEREYLKPLTIAEQRTLRRLVAKLI